MFCGEAIFTLKTCGKSQKEFGMTKSWEILNQEGEDVSMYLLFIENKIGGFLRIAQKISSTISGTMHSIECCPNAKTS